ncbi:MAG: DUF2784 domain-containing protein [Acidobacteria bacterium]|nr:MAG: DUF2784 domain-containing protein [Acidobacteriota bacterium]
MLVFRMPMSQIRTPTLAASSSGGWRSHKPLGRFWVALVYGIVSELGPWACPLTLAENYFEARAGIAPYQGPFLLHYLDAIVYPNLSPTLLTVCGVAVCAANLIVYAWRFRWAKT